MFTENIAQIEKKYPKIAKIIIDGYGNQVSCNEIYIEKSKENEKIIAIEKNNHKYYLNSTYNARKAAGQWAQQYKECPYQSVFIVFGVANGMYVQELLKVLDDSASVLVYEPDSFLFYQLLEQWNLSEIIENDKVLLTGGEEMLGAAIEWMSRHISYMNYKRVNFCICPNYEVLYPGELTQYYDLCVHQLQAIDSIVYSELKFMGEFQENILHNIFDYVKQSTINQLKEQLEECNKKEIPVIIVAAGPSLDKNIVELKRAKGKAFLIVVDTALRAVLKAGIMPDLSITVDPHKPVSLFQKKEIENIPFMYCKYSNWKLLKCLKGRRFYSGHGEDFIGAINYNIKGETIDNIDSGGSVAHEGFSLAVYLGFQKIILVGQDLAYPNGQAHTKDAYTKEEDSLENKNLIWVEDIYGNQVQTEPNMDMYRRWFEKQIARYGEKIHVMDATEGGAKISGAEIISLKDAIDRECRREYDFHNAILGIPTNYTQLQQQEIMDYLNRLPEIVEGLKEKIQEGIDDYQNLYQLYREGKEGQKIQALIKKIGERNQWIEQQGELELVSMYNKEEEYKVQEEVYAIKDNENDEISDIVNSGVYMLKSYISGIEKLQKDWKNCMKELQEE